MSFWEHGAGWGDWLLCSLGCFSNDSHTHLIVFLHSCIIFLNASAGYQCGFGHRVFDHVCQRGFASAYSHNRAVSTDILSACSKYCQVGCCMVAWSVCHFLEKSRAAGKTRPGRTWPAHFVNADCPQIGKKGVELLSPRIPT